MAHLSLEDRETIELALKDNKNFTQIGLLVNKHRTSIADEIINIKLNSYLIFMEGILFFVNMNIIVIIIMVLGLLKDVVNMNQKNALLLTSLHMFVMAAPRKMDVNLLNIIIGLLMQILNI